MASKKMEEPKGADLTSDTDILDLFNKYRTKILSAIGLVILIIVVVIVYFNYSSEKENSAWSYFSTFMSTFSSAETVTETDMQELMKEIDGTTAEPWGIYYCSYLYFQKRDYDNAKKMLETLESKYKNHYICKNSNILDQNNEYITSEMEWSEKNSNLP